MNFLRALGFIKLSEGVMRVFTDQLNKHIEKEAKKYKVPIIPWQEAKKTGKSKLKYVQKNYAEKYRGIGNFLLCIITAQENVFTFASRELTSKEGKKYTKVYKCKKMVKHYYIYFYDELLGGPCYLRICSYLPFDSEFYFNGHNAIKLGLTKRGIGYKMKDNAFISVEDSQILQEIAQSMNGKSVLERIQHWMDRFFKFDKGSYSTCHKYLKHEWYISQVEICSNVIFKSSRFCTSLFERLLERFCRFGLPDSICQIFDKRPRRRNFKSTWRSYNNNVCMHQWFKNNSVKIYNKSGSFIRVETTINNPKSLGHKLKKPAIYLLAYFWFGFQCNGHFYDCCADIDCASISGSETDLFNKPVLDDHGKKFAAPDLRKDRQLELSQELLNPRYSVFGFKTSDLLSPLSEYFRNSAEIRYELGKLKIRGVVTKKQGMNLYEVTEIGRNWLWLQICFHDHFQNPMISRILKKQTTQTCTQPSQIEEAYSFIDQGLSLFSQAVGLKN